MGDAQGRKAVINERLESKRGTGEEGFVDFLLQIAGPWQFVAKGGGGVGDKWDP